MKTDLETLALLSIAKPVCPCAKCDIRPFVESAIAELRAARAVVEAAREAMDNRALNVAAEPNFYAALLAYDKVVGS